MSTNSPSVVKSLSKPPEKLSEKGVAVLKKYLADCLAIGVKGMAEEFEVLNKECAAMEKPAATRFKEMEKINRSPEVLCPDKSRVVLTLNVPPALDYYHANVVKVKPMDREFIACQAPLEETIYDFWRMVYQEGCSTVFICGSPDINKVPVYWPIKKGDHTNYKDIFVNNRRVEEFPEFKLYKIEVLPHGCSNSVILHLVVFNEWYEREASSLKKFSLFRAWKQLPMTINATAPVVVHGRLGIGRTGELILMHAGILAIFKGVEVDMKNILKEMRQQRPCLVETAAQYVSARMQVLYYFTTISAEICADLEILYKQHIAYFKK